MDGPPLPEVHGTCHAIKIVIVSVLLGYFDVGSDVYCSVLLQVRPHDVVWARLFFVLREWFFLVLPYLWEGRCLIVCMAALKSGGRVGFYAAHKALKHFRFRLRLVAMPFLDSVMDGTVAFASGLALTLAEFIACLVIYHFCRHDDLPSRVRRVLNVVAISCMVGKMCLALVAIFPLKKDRDGSEGQGDAGEDSGAALSRGGVVADESVAGSEMTAMAKVDCGIAPSEGGQLEPATHTMSALATSSARGDAKVDDRFESV